MGTDHDIVIAKGYRIPFSIWNAFRNDVHAKFKEEQRQYWKKRKIEDSYDPEEEGDEYIENDSYQLDIETDFVAITEPDTDCTFAFFSQGTYSHSDENSNKYVLIAKKDSAFDYLMSRKIGGAMMGHFTGANAFEHMQNVESLDFSIDLEGVSSYSDDTVEVEIFLNSLPELLKDFLKQFPARQYYSLWIFGYGC